MFDGNDEVLAVCRSEPVVRIRPVKHKPKARSLKWLRDTMPYQEIGSEVLIREDRDARD